MNSTFEKVDYPIYLAPAAWEHKDIVEKGNVFYDFQGNTPVTLRLYATTSDQVKTNHFESLNGKDFTKLPLCHVTESSPGFAECFEGMSVFYNGKPAICHNLKWYDYAGNVLA